MDLRDKIYTLIALVGLFLLLGVLNVFLSDYHMRIVNLIGINIALVVSLNLTNGFCGVFSLGHAGFMAVGAYVAAILALPLEKKAAVLPQLPAWLGSVEISFFPALLAGGLVASLCALILGYPVLRLRGHYLAVATLGFLVIVQVFITQLNTITRGARGINGLLPSTNVWWVWGTAVFTIYIVWRIVHSSYGRGMLAIREERPGRGNTGRKFNLSQTGRLLHRSIFAASGVRYWGHLITVVTHRFPSPMTGPSNLVVMSVVGGMSSISGVLVLR